MRHAWFLFAGVGLLTALAGCHPCQHTAGVCDCDPPPVGALVYGTYAPPAPAHAGPVYATPGVPGTVVPAMPPAPLSRSLPKGHPAARTGAATVATPKTLPTAPSSTATSPTSIATPPIP
jgi:hypothetical protein